ncbi:MAG: oxygen-independent coproporphyrinogen III oxidase [Microscillaceae bacterium]|jgi:oxygen-independent coproporphyrinogen-3 oxidase|nr:oxygen-independent coproporphyrinogen III oxidase [Microscillaceae bacterium]
MQFTHLIQKYDIPTPRYTSYPTVPFWDDNLDESQWRKQVIQAYQANQEGISLYIHLPFCEKLCTYCGCNKRITVNHQVEHPYMQAILQEWAIYRAILGEKPLIREIHLGGGTPTFFSADNLHYLINQILQNSRLHPDYEMGLEIHPNVTQAQQLQVLYDLGFTRLSVGVQDFDPKVQDIINRHQTFIQTQAIIASARQIGYQSINIDIIYGLPLQTAQSIRDTIDKIKILQPERLAFYSYAHVPWKSKAQRRYSEADLPQGAEKRALYELGRTQLLAAGYHEIGLDHFALSQDGLYQAANQGTLHRNFMGYTTRHTRLLLGLGASSIGDTWGAFMQNIKEVEEYQATVAQGKLPIFKGHLLTDEDLILRKHILQILCKGETDWENQADFCAVLPDAMIRWQSFVEDGLVELQSQKVIVTPLGRAFLRNIAMQADARLWRKTISEPLFSRAV